MQLFALAEMSHPIHITLTVILQSAKLCLVDFPDLKLTWLQHDCKHYS